MLPRVTRERLRDADSRYGEDRERELVPKGGLSPREVATLDIPVENRWWALVYASGASYPILREHACWCARQALDAERAAGREPDPRSWASVDVAERYARREATQDELDAAHVSARAARDGVSDAACSAACASLRGAVDAASRAGTWAAGAASWVAQLSDLVARLEDQP